MAGHNILGCSRCCETQPLRVDGLKIGNEPDSFITGLCLDQLAPEGVGWQYFGTTSTKSAKHSGLGRTRAHYYRPDEAPSPVPMWVSPQSGAMLLLSIASFKEVQRLCVCRLGPRCTGLQVVHSDDTIEVLGQWHSDAGSIKSVTYDISEGPLARVAFCSNKARVSTPKTCMSAEYPRKSAALVRHPWSAPFMMWILRRSVPTRRDPVRNYVCFSDEFLIASCVVVYSQQ